MGNGAKAAMKRERNAKKDGKKDTSQKKSNEAAKSTICKVCFNAFMCTVKEGDLSLHAENKHGKTMKECFPDYVPAPKKDK